MEYIRGWNGKETIALLLTGNQLSFSIFFFRGKKKAAYDLLPSDFSLKAFFQRGKKKEKET